LRTRKKWIVKSMVNSHKQVLNHTSQTFGTEEGESHVTGVLAFKKEACTNVEV
jgi:hypothetical protein